MTSTFTALVLCCSSAEYACPVWDSSTHAKKQDPALNTSNCLKPTNINNLHLLAGIAPADIRREVASRVEQTKHLVMNAIPSMDVTLRPNKKK